MYKKSRHMTYDDRLKIEALYKKKHTQVEIANVLGFTQQSISREIKRGIVQQLDGSTWTMYKIYSAEKAQRDTEYKMTAKGAPLKIGNHHDLALFIECKIIHKGFSPYAVAKAVNENPDFKIKLSPSTIYNYVHSGIFLCANKCHLPRKGKGKQRKQPQKRAAFRNILKPSITERFAPRSIFGHWEMDTVIGQARGSNNVLLVLTERKTRYEIIIKIKRKKAIYVVKALQTLRRKFGKYFKRIFKTITVDNGAEFSDYDGMSCYTDIFYCHPYSSSERGSNENANGLIRRHIPKGVNMNKVTHKEVLAVETWMNNYPRKILGTTAEKAFQHELSMLE